MKRLQIGEKAPEFSLPNQNGETVSLSTYLGEKHIVLYFYPKDETPGCTKEACGFRDRYEAFLEAGAEVIGVSADSVGSHQKFASQRSLPFQLLSDPHKELSKRYGVSNSMLGLLPGRETFVIDKQGVIRHHFASQFQIDPHIEEALTVIQALEG